MVVDNTNLGVAESPSDTAGVIEPLVSAKRREAEVLGHAVGHHHPLGTEQFEPPAQQGGWHHRRSLQDPLDARQVSVLDAGNIGDARQHRRRRGEGGDPVSLDGVENQCGVELLEHHQVVAAEQIGQRVEPVGVVHRRGNQDRLGLAHRRPLRHERHALCLSPRRRRGVEDDLGQAGGSGTADAVECGRDDLRHCCVVLALRDLGQSRQILLADLQGRLDDVQQPLVFPVRQIPAHRDGYGTHLPRGQGGDDELYGVGNRQRDHVTLVHRRGLQGACPLVGRMLKAGPRQCRLAAVAVYDGERGAVRLLRSARGELVAVRDWIVRAYRLGFRHGRRSSVSCPRHGAALPEVPRAVEPTARG